MKKILSITLIAVTMFALIGCRKGPTHEEVCELLPELTGVENQSAFVGTQIDFLENVEVISNCEDMEYTVEVANTDYVQNEKGKYFATYIVYDQTGLEVLRETINIDIYGYEFANSVYDLSEESEYIRTTFFNAAESYLFDNLYGGVPLFSDADHYLISDRLVPSYEGSLPFVGSTFDLGSMSQDDSQVQFLDNYTGSIGEYTYRSAMNDTIESFNPWHFDFYGSGELAAHTQGYLYQYTVNDTKDGVELLPDLASDLPFNENQDEYSTSWIIPLKQNMEWYFHSDTDQAFFDGNPNLIIDASDIEETIKLAADNQWYKLINPCGSMIDCVSNIENLSEYIYDNESWDEVGIKANGNFLELEFVYEMNQFEVMQEVIRYIGTPINVDYYNYLITQGEVYGDSHVNVAYSGEYFVSEYVEDSHMHLLRNQEFNRERIHSYDGFLYHFLQENETMYELFNNGYIEAMGLTFEEYMMYKDDLHHSNVYITSSPKIFKMNINRFGTLENQQTYFPESTYVPEPILSYDKFIQALYLGIDRDVLASDVSDNYFTPELHYFNQSYYLDVEYEYPIRNSELGSLVGETFLQDSDGFDVERSKQLFLEAVSEMIRDEVITFGTVDEPVIIEIDILTLNNDMWNDIFAEMKSQYESIFVDEVNYVEVHFNQVTHDDEFLIWADNMDGVFDIVMGSVLTSTLDADNNLFLYRSTNKYGYAYNFGFDSSVPNIQINYMNEEGEEMFEIFSFDAIESMLNGETYIYEGQEFYAPVVSDINTTPTSIELSLENTTGHEYDYITYTLYRYDNYYNDYLEVPGYTNRILVSEEISFPNLVSFSEYVFGHSFGSMLLYGDYYVEFIVSFEDTDYTYRFEESFQTDPVIISNDSPVVTATSFTWDISIDESDYERVITDVNILIDTGDNYETAVVTVDYTDLSAFTITGLTPSSEYVIEITFDDDSLYGFNIETLSE